jgi:predicted HAD superfamily Cof-like phosphohydrolase
MIKHVTQQQMVERFTKAMGQPVDQEPTPEVARLRQDLIMEEAAEVWDELERPVINKAALTKELADLLYVVHGTAVAFGLPLEPAFVRVHESNMSKLDTDYKPIFNEAGKVMKGPFYKPPSLEDLFD